jgi:hypothetical protein
MVSSEVKRTLVKSPPELWAELSDAAALTRHLGALGEIRITRTKPEERVEWEAEGVTGSVQLKASGWGTKVTLSVTRELGDPEPSIQAEAAEQAVTIEEPDAEAEAEQTIASEVPAVVAEPEAMSSAEPVTEPRRGFFARLFRRRTQLPAEPEPAAISEPAPVPEPSAVEEPPEPAEEGHLEQPSSISAELQATEDAVAEEVTEVLSAALDRLGAAHHRPFSRA